MKLRHLLQGGGAAGRGGKQSRRPSRTPHGKASRIARSTRAQASAHRGKSADSWRTKHCLRHTSTGEHHHVAVSREGAIRHPDGAKALPETLKIYVIKMAPISLLSKVQPYLTSAGINMPEAALPSGKYNVRVAIADDKGRQGMMEGTWIVK